MNYCSALFISFLIQIYDCKVDGLMLDSWNLRLAPCFWSSYFFILQTKQSWDLQLMNLLFFDTKSLSCLFIFPDCFDGAFCSLTFDLVFVFISSWRLI